MIIFISDIDTAIFYVHFFETISAVCSFVKVLIYMNKTLNGRSLVKKTKTLFTWSGGPRSSGVGFFCFVFPRA